MDFHHTKRLNPAWFIAGLLFFSTFATQANSDPASTTQARHKELAKVTINELLSVKSGLKNFYVDNMGAWPVDVSDVSAFYSGTFMTPIGEIKGVRTTNQYEIFIDAGTLDDGLKAQIETELAKNNGGWNGNRAIVKVDTPQAAAIVRSSLSRFADPSGTGELNTMYTDLLMNNNDITGLNELNASNVIANSATIGQLVNTQLTSDTANIGTAIITQANLTNANIDTALIDTATIDMATVDTAAISTLNGDVASFATLTSTTATLDQADVNVLNANTVNAALAALDDATIANTLTVNGAALFGDSVTIAGNTNLGGNLYSNGALVIDNAGKLYYQGQDLDTRFLGITDTAANADMLGGIDASRFARTDISNTFVAPQTFSSGITVGGTGIATNNLDATGNVYTNNMYVKSRSTWISSTIDKANSAYSRIGTLENKFNSGAGSNAMGTWVSENRGDRDKEDVYNRLLMGRVSYWNFKPPTTYSGQCVKGMLGYIENIYDNADNRGEYYHFYKCI